MCSDRPTRKVVDSKYLMLLKIMSICALRSLCSLSRTRKISSTKMTSFNICATVFENAQSHVQSVVCFIRALQVSIRRGSDHKKNLIFFKKGLYAHWVSILDPYGYPWGVLLTWNSPQRGSLINIYMCLYNIINRISCKTSVVEFTVVKRLKVKLFKPQKTHPCWGVSPGIWFHTFARRLLYLRHKLLFLCPPCLSMHQHQ